jgi:hypothetical protein
MKPSEQSKQSEKVSTCTGIKVPLRVVLPPLCVVQSSRSGQRPQPVPQHVCGGGRQIALQPQPGLLPRLFRALLRRHRTVGRCRGGGVFAVFAVFAVFVLFVLFVLFVVFVVFGGSQQGPHSTVVKHHKQLQPVLVSAFPSLARPTLHKRGRGQGALPVGSRNREA